MSVWQNSVEHSVANGVGNGIGNRGGNRVGNGVEHSAGGMGSLARLVSRVMGRGGAHAADRASRADETRETIQIPQSPSPEGNAYAAQDAVSRAGDVGVMRASATAIPAIGGIRVPGGSAAPIAAPIGAPGAASPKPRGLFGFGRKRATPDAVPFDPALIETKAADRDADLPMWVRLAIGTLKMLAASLVFILLNILLFSQVQYNVRQARAYSDLRQSLAAATVPVSELDVDDKLVEDGTPLAYLKIPQIGLNTVIVEGTTAHELMTGPGHQRNTVLPGQPGTSILQGRAAGWGGPFSRIERLAPGDVFDVTTGQGEFQYKVVGVRYAGDPGLAVSSKASRIVLTSARGFPFMPEGVVRVDAELIGETQPVGTRITTALSLPAAAMPMASDTRTVWALVLWLEVLVAVEAGGVWIWHRWGKRQFWVGVMPVIFVLGLQVSDQIAILLPNLM